MRIHSVILDANTLIRDYKLSGREIRKLTKTKDLYSFKLCIPEVVYDECVGNYIAESKSRHEELSKTIDKTNEILPIRDQINKEAIERKLKNSIKRYRNRLNKLIKSNNIILLKYPKISHKDVVKRMYEKNQPFNNSNYSEKGYKDYLIAESIREYINKDAIDARLIFVTDNFRDFVEKSSAVAKDRAMALAESFDLDSVCVTHSQAVLFEELKQNLKENSAYHTVKNSASDISMGIKESIMQNDVLLHMDIFGFCIFNINIEELTCEITDHAIEINEESEILEASGIFKLSAICSFAVDNYNFDYLEDDFPFKSQVIERVKLKKLSSKDDWVEQFNKIDFKSEFIFSYIDFDYSKSTNLRKIDPTFLSISKI